jgi:NAD(P)H dehydrogenase (quinone)
LALSITSITEMKNSRAHPDAGSFNHAIAKTAVETLRRAGHAVHFHDLYAEGFDPVLPAVEIPAGVVIVHPNWWGQPPALLKGWIDRVIRPGVAFNFLEGDSGEGGPVDLLKAKTAIVFNTANAPAESERTAFSDPLELIWRNCVFALCGVADVRREVFGVVVTSTDEQREGWLERVRDLLSRSFPAMAACVKGWPTHALAQKRTVTRERRGQNLSLHHAINRVIDVA